MLWIIIISPSYWAVFYGGMFEPPSIRAEGMRSRKSGHPELSRALNPKTWPHNKQKVRSFPTPEDGSNQNWAVLGRRSYQSNPPANDTGRSGEVVERRDTTTRMSDRINYPQRWPTHKLGFGEGFRMRGSRLRVKVDYNVALENPPEAKCEKKEIDGKKIQEVSFSR